MSKPIPMTTVALLTVLGCVALIVGALVLPGLRGKPSILALCEAHGYSVDCTFTNTGKASGSACVTAAISLKVKPFTSATSTVVCSGDLAPNSNGSGHGAFLDHPKADAACAPSGTGCELSVANVTAP